MYYFVDYDFKQNIDYDAEFIKYTSPFEINRSAKVYAFSNFLQEHSKPTEIYLKEGKHVFLFLL